MVGPSNCLHYRLNTPLSSSALYSLVTVIAPSRRERLSLTSEISVMRRSILHSNIYHRIFPLILSSIERFICASFLWRYIHRRGMIIGRCVVGGCEWIRQRLQGWRTPIWHMRRWGMLLMLVHAVHPVCVRRCESSLLLRSAIVWIEELMVESTREDDHETGAYDAEDHPSDLTPV